MRLRKNRLQVRAHRSDFDVTIACDLGKGATGYDADCDIGFGTRERECLHQHLSWRRQPLFRIDHKKQQTRRVRRSLGTIAQPVRADDQRQAAAALHCNGLRLVTIVWAAAGGQFSALSP
jgi:hypothetical protein